MKNVYKQKREQGFTIIEVLIVLAIAALILLIVFLAVPALQRNSRNNSTRQEAGDILAAVNDFVANNQGQLPTAAGISCSNGAVTVSGASGTTSSETKVRGGTQCDGNGTLPPSPGTISIAIGSKCNGNVLQANPRAFAALFRIETGSGASGTAAQCLES